MISSSSTFKFILFWKGVGVALFFLPPGYPFFSCSQSPCLYCLGVTHISSPVQNTHSDYSISFTYPVLLKLDLESTHCSSFQLPLFYYSLLSHTDLNCLTCFEIINAQPHVLSPSQRGYSQTATTLTGILDFSGPGSSLDLGTEQTGNVRKLIAYNLN